MITTIPTDQAISAESPSVHLVRHSPIIFATTRDPFQNPAGHNKSDAEKMKPFGSPTAFAKNKENTQSTVAVTNPSTIATKSPLSNPRKMFESQDSEELAVPAVAFPYITHVSKKLIEDFQMIEEQIPPLPCEIEALSVELLPVPPPSLRTLLVGLEKTLVSIGPVPARKITVRPHAIDFLKEASEKFELIIFSAEPKPIVAAALKALDPSRRYLKHTLTRENCIQRDENLFIKDLRILKGRCIEKTIILDSSAFSFMGQLENGIYIPPFEGAADEDKELLTILEFLLTLKGGGDVRPMVKKFAGILRAIKLVGKSGIMLKENPGEKAEVEEDEDSECDIGNEYE